MDDSILAIAAQNGDKKAFGSLIDKYYQSIYRLAYQYTSCSYEADEICQETFLKALSNLHKLKNPSLFKYWLFRISSNLLRAGHKRKQLFYNYLNMSGPTEQQTQEQPLKEMIEIERRNIIGKCLQEMPEQMRLVTIMVLMEGLDQKETASILRSSEASVSRHLAQAKQWLKPRLQRYLINGAVHE